MTTSSDIRKANKKRIHFGKSKYPKGAEYCGKSVPAKYMPEFKIVADFDEFLINGMFQIAIKNKEL